MILSDGHEVGCHGLTHEHDKAFDILTKNQQYEHLVKAKNILEDISGKEVQSFRAPALRVNRDTGEALLKSGFKIDSSIASQRADSFLSFGTKEKIKWLTAPRKPYFTCINNLSRRGDSDICEFPVPAYLLPYIGTMMRISPFLTRINRSLANIESKLIQTIPHFIIHPNELITEDKNVLKIIRRGNSFISYLLGDKVRYYLKLKNLGLSAVELFENQIKYFHSRGYRFITLKNYYENYIN